MAALIGILGFLLFASILWDAFETIILPRRVTRRFRLTRAFYRCTRAPWLWIAGRIKSPKHREAFLGVFGPMSVLALFTLWAVCLIVSFGMMDWAVTQASAAPQTFRSQLYLSGDAFFTLGTGDILPFQPLTRLLTVVGAGVGFGFLAVIISYLPVLYGGFSKRETNISMLDARAGSPPTAAELLRRHVRQQDLEGLAEYLRNWETWAAELMESHISYPVLCYFRSQHNNQSWLSALAAILDTCTLLMAHTEGRLQAQAEMTFAICRHALVDLAQAVLIPPRTPSADRFDADTLAEIRNLLASAGAPLCKAGDCEGKVNELRQMYEPYLCGFSERLYMPLPAWSMTKPGVDNWRTSAWGSLSVRADVPVSTLDDDHA